MNLEQRITEMVKSEGLDPALWCWVGVDKDGDVYVFDKKPKLREGIYSGPSHCHVGQIETDEPQLFKFNPFADTETSDAVKAAGRLFLLNAQESRHKREVQKLQSDLDAAKFHIRKLARHLSAANPTYMHRDDVSMDIREALKLTNQK